MIELVLARYNEDVSWVNQDVRKDIKLTVYNKSGTAVPGQISLPNVGREAHTYLYHIIANHGHFPEWTFFAHADPFAHVNNFREILNAFPASADRAVLSPAPGAHFFVSCPKDEVEGLCYGHVWNAAVREIFRQLFTCEPPAKMYFTRGAIFAISSDLLMTRSKAFYEQAQEILLARPVVPGASFMPGPPESAGAWEYERLWDLLWRQEYTPFK